MPPVTTGSAEPTACAVVVTRNRRDLLRGCLAALEAQTRRPDAILVIDNASDDGTDGMLATDYPGVSTLRLDENQGGAGGFFEGVKAAYELGFDWLWLMDDDTEPTASALETLLRARAIASRRGPPAVLASRVLWSDDHMHPMNKPKGRRLELDAMIELKDAQILAEGLVPIRAASFVSILVSRDAVAAHGLPHKHYFVWNDDIEYTGRILREDDGYLVLDSVAYHRTKSAYTVWETTGPRFYFEVRNKLFLIRSDSFSRLEKAEYAIDVVHKARRYLRHNRYSRAALGAVARGTRDGLTQRGGAA